MTNQEYYVYVATDEQNNVVYVGSGKGDRIEHVNSGHSHSKVLNKHVLTVGELSVCKVAEGLSKADSLAAEQVYQDQHKPIHNKNKAVADVTQAKHTSENLLFALYQCTACHTLLSVYECRLLAALITFSDRKHTTSISTTDLITNTGMSTKTIERSRKVLSDSGWISITSGKGMLTTNHYTINTAKIVATSKRKQ